MNIILAKASKGSLGLLGSLVKGIIRTIYKRVILKVILYPQNETVDKPWSERF